MDAPQPPRSELREHFPLLAASAASVGLGMGGMSVFLLGVFAGPVTAELGWSLGFFQLASLVLMPALIVAGPIVGGLVDRHGSRRVALPSLAMFGLALASLALATPAAWTWIVPWLLIGLAGTGTSGIAWAPSISARFDRRRGLALAIMLSGSSLVATVGPSLARLLIDAQGWRLAYVAIGAVPALLATSLVAWLTRGESGVGLSAAPTTASTTTGTAARDALRDPRFWLLAGAFSIVMLAIGGLIANLVPILRSRGYTPVAAAGLAGVLGAALITGRLLTGALVDRFSPRIVSAAALALPSLSPLLLMLGDGVVAAIAGIALLGLAAGAEFDLVAYLCGRVFGLRQFGRIYALMTIPPTLTASVGAPVLGLVHDRTGSFTAAAWPLAALVLAGGALLLRLQLPGGGPQAGQPARSSAAAQDGTATLRQTA